MTCEDDPVGELRARCAGRRVALVHDWLNGMRGGEKVLEQVCQMFPGAHVFTLFLERGRLSPALRRMNLIESAWTTRFPSLRRHYRKLLPLLPAMIGALPTAEYDLVISTSHCVAKGAPPPAEGIHLSYVFTPMRYVWDHFEDYLSGKPLQDTALRLARPRLQEWDRMTARRIDAIAADSWHIADKIERFWNRKSRVIHPPVDLDFFTPMATPPPDRAPFLVVAALVPYKHVRRAIEAARIAEKPLVIVGDGPERTRLEAGARPNVQFRGWVSDTDLRDAYRQCAALLYPGIEDFGITSLEAQACGRPVLAFRGGGAVETVAEGITGAFFDSPDAESLARLLTAFDSQAYDSEGIRAHAESFSPPRFRREVASWALGEIRKRW
ncbi:glycosyltransferase [Candidatus Poribacteria bacterium]|nr:glycosyltransferase [Candidatus Poribacteria bacterium]